MVRTFACLVALAAAAPAFAEEKFDAAKLVGTWKMTKSESLPEGATATVVFAKDNTMTAVVEIMGMKIELKGTWKIEGDKMVTTIKEGDKEKTDKDTITKLTDDEFATKDDDGKTETFKKVKEEKKDEKKEEKK